MSSPDYSDERELKEVEELARTLGVEIGEVKESGDEANFAGIRSEQILVSKRLDSRTVFVHDESFGGAGGSFGGSDDELIEIGKRVLERLDVPSSEIGEPTIAREQTQAAQVDEKGKIVSMEDPEQRRRVAHLPRAIEGMPVWSSELLLALTERGSPGFLQLHWPEIPSQVVQEARRLRHKVERGWRPPAQPGATVESVEAGIIHSPAVGFVMDVYAAIRVIYKPRRKTIGRKLMLHFDRHGKTVPTPRQFDLPPAEPTGPRKKPRARRR
jgi:hypothetical protein